MTTPPPGDDDYPVRIELNIFVNWNADACESENVRKNVSAILDKYSCMTSIVPPASTFVYPLIRKPINRHHQSPSFQHQHHHNGDSGSVAANRLQQRRGGGGSWKSQPESREGRQQRPILPGMSSISTFMKRIMSALNKLTTNNFDKLSDQIISNAVLTRGVEHDDEVAATKNDAFVEVCDVLLTKCCSDPGYIPLYANLLTDFVEKIPPTESASMRKRLEDFAHEAIEGFLVDDFDVPEVRDYDAFCKSIKRIQVALSKNAVIVNLIDRGLVVDTNREMYLATIVKMFNDSAPGKRAEMALDFMAKFIEYFCPLHANELKMANEVVDEGMAYENAHKIRFKVMNIRDSMKDSFSMRRACNNKRVYT
jgi:hypothetical protein